MNFFGKFVHFFIGFASIFIFLGTYIDASIYACSHLNSNYSLSDNTDLDNDLANSKMFKISDIETNKTSANWWKKIILNKYKPVNNFDNAVIQNKKYDYTNDSSKYNPSVLPGYRNVAFSDYSTHNQIYKNSAIYDIGYDKNKKIFEPNLTLQNSFSKKYYFDTNSGLTNDFSWYSPDPTIVNDNHQPNRAPVLNSEYNGNFAGSRSLLFGMNFGLPTSLEYSMKTISQTGTNASIADLNYQYNFSLPNPFIDNSTFTDSGSSSAGLPTNAHYDQIKDPAKKITNPNKSDFAFYQLWRSVTNHNRNTRNDIINPWWVDKVDDKGSSGTLKKPHIGHFFQYDPLPFNTNPNPIPPPTPPTYDQKPKPNKWTKIQNPNYNPLLLRSNFIGHPPTELVLNGRIKTFVQANLISYPFYIEDSANHTVYLIHCYVLADSTTGSSRIITFYSKFSYQASDKETQKKLVLQKQGLINDLLFNNYRSAADKDVTKLNNSYKFCEKMLPFFVDRQSSVVNSNKNSESTDFLPNYDRPSFYQDWLSYLNTGSFSYKYDGQLKLMYADSTKIPPKIITEYPKIRQKYIVDASQIDQAANNNKYHNIFVNNDLLNYNQNIYKNNFAKALQQNKVEYTKSYCNKSPNSYTFPPLKPVNWILYHFLITNGASEYFDENNKDQASELNAYNPYRYYTAIVGCQTDQKFQKPLKSTAFPNPFFSVFLLSSPSVGTNVSNSTGNSTSLSFSSQNLPEFANSGKTIKDVDKLNHVYVGNGGFVVQSWIISLTVIFLLLIGAFLIYYIYRRKQIKIWRAKKEMYQKIGPQTQRDIAVDDIIHLINDVKIEPPKILKEELKPDHQTKEKEKITTTNQHQTDLHDVKDNTQSKSSEKSIAFEPDLQNEKNVSN